VRELSDNIVIVGCIVFLFVVLPIGAILGYKNRRRLFSNVAAVAETIFMNYQSQSKARAMEHVQYAREDEEEADDSGEPANT
jgi:hypothetical protein